MASAETAGRDAALDLSFVIPVFNEAGNIVPLAEEIAAAIGDALAYEIVFVDDGSSDSSPAELLDARARFAGVRVITHTTRSGKSAAVWTGCRAARGPWVQMLDGDRQNNPADVLMVWNRIHEPGGTPDPALGIVAGQRTSRNDGRFKWLQSRIANGIRRTVLNDGTRDTGCGFKLIRREAFDTLPFFDGMHRFLPALVRRAGYDVLEIPVEDRPRGAGTSKYGFLGRLGAGIFDLFGVMWLIRRSTFPAGRTGDL
jgi:dolichol-phosphate mannosyltransferase